jgi:hypothetical protein
MSAIWDKNGRIAIPVEQSHIARALERDSSHCAVAEAIKAAIPDATFVAVDLQTVRFSRKGLRYVFLTPHLARDCIIAFDQGERDKLQPFTLKLRPAVIAKAGKKRTHTPSNGELRGSGLTVNKTQLHISEPEPNRVSPGAQRHLTRSLAKWGNVPPASAKMELRETNKAQLKRELRGSRREHREDAERRATQKSAIRWGNPPGEI